MKTVFITERNFGWKNLSSSILEMKSYQKFYPMFLSHSVMRLRSNSWYIFLSLPWAITFTYAIYLKKFTPLINWIFWRWILPKRRYKSSFIQ